MSEKSNRLEEVITKKLIAASDKWFLDSLYGYGTTSTCSKPEPLNISALHKAIEIIDRIPSVPQIIESLLMVDEVSTHTRPYPNRKKKNRRWIKKWAKRHTKITMVPKQKVAMVDVPGLPKYIVAHPLIAKKLRVALKEHGAI